MEQRKIWYFNTWYFVIGVLLFVLSKIYGPLIFDLFYLYFVVFGFIGSWYAFSKVGETKKILVWGLVFFGIGNLIFGVNMYWFNQYIDQIPNALFGLQVLTKQIYVFREVLGIRKYYKRSLIFLNLGLVLISLYLKSNFTEYNFIDLYFLIESLVSMSILLVVNLVAVWDLRAEIIPGSSFLGLFQLSFLLGDMSFLENRIYFLGNSTDFWYFLGIVMLTYFISGLKNSLNLKIIFSSTSLNPRSSRLLRY